MELEKIFFLRQILGFWDDSQSDAQVHEAFAAPVNLEPHTIPGRLAAQQALQMIEVKNFLAVQAHN